MSNHSKPDHHHVGVASRKRKERDTHVSPTLSKSPAADNNWMLAGYLAHEFLTQGTLLGQKWDPARAEANLITPRSNNPSIRGVGRPPATAAAAAAGGEAKDARPQQQQQQKAVHSNYADVSSLLLKSEGTHIEGIVNPTQLARWLHL
ncbi:hypothetical protein MKX01_032698 [Papaver californicum]|nr:hypothetical protein MKX01_032698 [Papaver californicum]